MDESEESCESNCSLHWESGPGDLDSSNYDSVGSDDDNDDYDANKILNHSPLGVDHFEYEDESLFHEFDFKRSHKDGGNIECQVSDRITGCEDNHDTTRHQVPQNIVEHEDSHDTTGHRVQLDIVEHQDNHHATGHRVPQKITGLEDDHDTTGHRVQHSIVKHQDNHNITVHKDNHHTIGHKVQRNIIAHQVKQNMIGHKSSDNVIRDFIKVYDDVIRNKKGDKVVDDQVHGNTTEDQASCSTVQDDGNDIIDDQSNDDDLVDDQVSTGIIANEIIEYQVCSNVIPDLVGNYDVNEDGVKDEVNDDVKDEVNIDVEEKVVYSDVGDETNDDDVKDKVEPKVVKDDDLVNDYDVNDDYYVEDGFSDDCDVKVRDDTIQEEAMDNIFKHDANDDFTQQSLPHDDANKNYPSSNDVELETDVKLLVWNSIQDENFARGDNSPASTDPNGQVLKHSYSVIDQPSYEASPFQLTEAEQQEMDGINQKLEELLCRSHDDNKLRISDTEYKEYQKLSSRDLMSRIRKIEEELLELDKRCARITEVENKVKQEKEQKEFLF